MVQSSHCGCTVKLGFSKDCIGSICEVLQLIGFALNAKMQSSQVPRLYQQFCDSITCDSGLSTNDFCLHEGFVS